MVTERPISSIVMTLLMYALFISGIMLFYTNTLEATGVTLTPLEENITLYKAFSNKTTEVTGFVEEGKDLVTGEGEGDKWAGAFTFEMVFGSTGMIQQFFNLPNTLQSIFSSLFSISPELQAETRLLIDIISTIILAVIFFAAIFVFFKVNL